MEQISTKTVAFVLLVVIQSVSSQLLEGSISEYYFTIPDVTGDFNYASSWCERNNSTLAVVNDSYIQSALSQFLNSSRFTSKFYINVKLYQTRNTTWFLINGSIYLENMCSSYSANGIVYKERCFVKYETEQLTWYQARERCINNSGDLAQFQTASGISSPPFVTSWLSKSLTYWVGIRWNNLAWKSSESRCLNDSTNSIFFNGICYVKYENETLTWFQARERCIYNGGDLATFENDAVQSGTPQLDTSWLNLSLTYWVGIRWKNWRWNSPDAGIEAIYTSWSSLKPNNYSYQCVCVDPNGIPPWSWVDCSCDEKTIYVCMRRVITNTVSTTTTATTRTPIISLSPTREMNSAPNVLAIGFGAGLGGGVFIMALVIIVVTLMRKREDTRSNKRMNTTTKTSQVHLDGSTPRVDAADPDVHYQHLNMETAFGPGNENPIYEQLNQPENLYYEFIPQNVNKIAG